MAQVALAQKARSVEVYLARYLSLEADALKAASEKIQTKGVPVHPPVQSHVAPMAVAGALPEKV